MDMNTVYFWRASFKMKWKNESILDIQRCADLLRQLQVSGSSSSDGHGTPPTPARKIGNCVGKYPVISITRWTPIGTRLVIGLSLSNQIQEQRQGPKFLLQHHTHCGKFEHRILYPAFLQKRFFPYCALMQTQHWYNLFTDLIHDFTNTKLFCTRGHLISWIFCMCR